MNNNHQDTYEDLKTHNQTIKSMYSEASKKREYYLESTNFSNFSVKNEDNEMLVSEFDSVGGSALEITYVDDASFDKILLDESIPKETQVILVDKPSDIDETDQGLSFVEGQIIKVGRDSDVELLEIDDVSLTIDAILSSSTNDFIRNQINSTTFLMGKSFFENKFKNLLDNDYFVSSYFINEVYMNVNEAIEFKNTLENNLSEEIEVTNVEEHQMVIVNMYKLFDDVLKMVLALVFVIVITNMISVTIAQIESRRRELSVLMSIGMTKQDVNKMFYYETIISSVGPFMKATIISMFILMVYVNVVDKINPRVKFTLNPYSFIYSLCFVVIFILINSMVIHQKRKRQSVLDGIRSN